jgi:CRP-like cAMP-binding protein
MVSLERLFPSQLKRFFPFSLLEEPELNRLIPLIEVVNYPKGSMIYSSGDIPDAIYFIVSGEIQLMLQNEDSNPQRLTLTIQDHFGDEALSSMDYRLSGALATSEVSLLRISRSNLRQMQTQFSLLRRAFRLMLHSFKHQQHLQLPWLGKQEKILLITRKHSLFLILRVLLTGGIGLILAGILLAFAIHPGGVATGLFILAIFILLLGVFLSIWAGLEWTNDYFILTEDRVVVQKKWSASLIAVRKRLFQPFYPPAWNRLWQVVCSTLAHCACDPIMVISLFHVCHILRSNFNYWNTSAPMHNVSDSNRIRRRSVKLLNTGLPAERFETIASK